MKIFSRFIERLDTTTSTNKKVAYLAEYFDRADDADKLQTVALLSGRRPVRAVSGKQLRSWAADESGISDWLFEECYAIVGDLAETIALLLPNPSGESSDSLSSWLLRLRNLKKKNEEEKRTFIVGAWSSLSKSGKFVFNKLITGGFRIGVSQKLMVRALAKHTGLTENELAHRLMGNWDPFETSFKQLIYDSDESVKLSRPYPFYLAYSLDVIPGELGKKEQWMAEFKWDGIRSQMIVREGRVFLWSRGEELITSSHPELEELGKSLPDGTVIDGELVAFKKGLPLSFNLLQKRLNRKRVSSALMREVPVALIAYDLLEWNSEDIREKPLIERRDLLISLCNRLNHPKLLYSDAITWNQWEELEEMRVHAREYYSEGIMLKRMDSTYESGRKRGAWWKWKTDPLLIDGVLMYAMPGKGRRTNLFTDYTFGAWDGDRLIPFAKAYSGLTDEEFRSISYFVRRNTLERHGPVRAVKADLVFELAFEGIAPSARHKSGVALRFPRMRRWRKDKPASEACTLEELHALMKKFQPE